MHRTIWENDTFGCHPSFVRAFLARSRLLPRFLDVWLIINGLAYVAMSLTGFLFPRYLNIVANVTFPAIVGEVAFVCAKAVSVATATSIIG